MAQTLMLIDGNSIVNRAYFALPALNDNQGTNVNAVYGFTNILFKAIADYQPDKLVVAFDMPGHNFRKDLYGEYKANRHGMPEDLAEQMPILHQLLQCMNVTIVEKEGVEADDIIGTVAKSFDGKTVIVSGDRDMLQLVDESITVLLTKRGITDVETVTPDFLVANYQLTPQQIIEYKALRGDTSDNIPGVKGIGEKTATSLLQQYGTIEQIYDDIDNIKGSLHDKLVADKDMAFISKQLATIVTNADVQCDLSNANLPQPTQEALEFLTKLQFKSIIAKLSQDGVSVPDNKTVSVEAVNVETISQLKQVAQLMSDSPYFAFHSQDGVTYLANSETKQYVVRYSDSFLDEMSANAVDGVLLPLLQSDTPKAVYDNKYLKHSLSCKINSVRYDVCLMQYLVEYRAYKDVDSLCKGYGYNDLGCGVFYCAKKLEEQIKTLGLESLYSDIELPLSELLFRMEEEGVKVDEELLEQMSSDMHKELDALTNEIYQLAGEKFNINSPIQLSNVLFGTLGLPHGKKTQKGYSTNEEVLAELVNLHPVVEKIITYRKLSKLANTYVDGLKPSIKRGLVHTTYNQALTSTGRLSSSDPNLQNIPVRTERGKEIRKLFLPKNGVFVGADYSQIELRLLAAFSGDENLLDSFRKGEDVHARVAAELFGVPKEMVNATMRRTAKAVNFGIIYGISDFGLSQNTNLSVLKAREYIKLYFERFPKTKSYLDGLVEGARENGYTTTLTGRRRQLPELKSQNHNLRAFGERAAMNMPLQGSAADIMKIAMLKVDSAMRQAGLKSKLVLQIHDEIIVDCYPDEAEQVRQIVKEQMENAVSIACPLVAETEQGESLYEA